MMTWLTPTISSGRAEGNSTRHRSCLSVQPAIVPNSRMSGRTLPSATMVTRTIGGIA